MVLETVFGALPGTPSWQTIPYLGDGFTIASQVPPYMPDTNFGGGIGEFVAIQHRQDNGGSLEVLLWPQITKMLFDAVLARDGNGDLYSYSVQQYTPVISRQILGAVASGLDLKVTGTGEGETVLTTKWLAQSAIEIEALNPASDFPVTGIDLRPFLAGDAYILLNGVAAADIEEYTISVENKLFAGPLTTIEGMDLRVVRWFASEIQQVTLDLTQINVNSDLWQAMQAAESVSFEVEFRNPLGYTLGIQLPRLVIMAVTEDGTPSKVAREKPKLRALEPTAGASVINYAVDIATNATTMAPMTTEAPTTAGG